MPGKKSNEIIGIALAVDVRISFGTALAFNASHTGNWDDPNIRWQFDHK